MSSPEQVPPDPALDTRPHGLAWRLAVPFLHGRSRSGRAELRAAVAGRTVVVTGASFGIGAATACRLGGAGATVVLVARTRSRLDAVAEQVRAAGGNAHVMPADLSNFDQVGELAQRITAEHGAVDVLVNNAGKSIRRSMALSLDRFHDFERTMRLNYLSPVRLTLGLLPPMRERGRGHIVNVLSVASRVPPQPFYAAYQASKAALDVWSRSARSELAHDGVSISIVHMGLVHTRMSAPTPHYRDAPALSAAQAAAIVCDAVARRPLSVGPSWLRPAELAGVLWPSATEWQMRRSARRLEDSPNARAHLPHP